MIAPGRLEEETPEVKPPGDAERGSACHYLAERWIRRGIRPMPGEIVVVRNDSAHADYSPSSAHRWLECPGSVRLARQVRQAERAKTSTGITKITVSSEMVGWVDFACNFIEHEIKPRFVILPEQRAHVGNAFGFPSAIWGTDDVFGLSHDKSTLLVLDFKFGYRDVAVEDNSQLELYAIGEAHSLGWQVKKIQLVIVQPRVEEPIKVAELTVDQLGLKFMKYAPLVKRAVLQDEENTTLELHADASAQCLWCPAVARCPEFAKQALALSRRAVAPPVELLSVRDLALILSKEKEVSSFLKAAYMHALRLAQTGIEVPGYKVVRGRKHRRWINPDVAGHYLVELGVPREKVFAEELQLTPSQAEELPEVKQRKGVLDTIIELPLGDPQLAPLSDGRPALESEFKVVEGLDALL